MKNALLTGLIALVSLFKFSDAVYCGSGRYCNSGYYCCGLSCCRYNYSTYGQWWFWLIWVAVFIIIICISICARKRYVQRRAAHARNMHAYSQAFTNRAPNVIVPVPQNYPQPNYPQQNYPQQAYPHVNPQQQQTAYSSYPPPYSEVTGQKY